MMTDEQVPYWLLERQFNDLALLIALEHDWHVVELVRDFLNTDTRTMTAH